MFRSVIGLQNLFTEKSQKFPHPPEIIIVAMKINEINPKRTTVAYALGVLKGFFFENPKNEFALIRWNTRPRISNGTTVPGGAASTVITT